MRTESWDSKSRNSDIFVVVMVAVAATETGGGGERWFLCRDLNIILYCVDGDLINVGVKLDLVVMLPDACPNIRFLMGGKLKFTKLKQKCEESPKVVLM